MDADEQFVLGHISDLHFSEGTDQGDRTHAHSIDLLIGLNRRISSLQDKLDLLVVSGDVSNHGDRQSLITASGYLLSTIPIGNGQFVGLSAPADSVRVIPGNHDAWNASSSGTLIDRRQKSLEHFNFAFPDSKISEAGCYYDWLQKGNCAIYFAFVDTCFLGDTEENGTSTFGTVRLDQAVAKGKLTIQQTEQLLEWNDRGMRGALRNPRRSEEDIDAAVFAKSLKILVMHHYLFEPPERKSDYFMRLTHRDIVFRNVALADFDVMLCGHKHVAAFDVHAYGDHFDDRAVHRYMLNYFRRLIGLESLPLQFTDDRGRRFSKSLTWMVQTIASWFTRRHPTEKAEHLADRVMELLKGGLDEPDKLDRRIREFLRDNGESGAATLEPAELKTIQKRIAVGFDKRQRAELRKIADGLAIVVKDLAARPFLQIMSGSTTKNLGGSDKKRSFNVYRIRFGGGGWELTCERYPWVSDSFAQNPLVLRHDFRRKLSA